ncbi:MAG: nickel-responsive transcriptional regulator NikR [Candidatus Methanospirareceae archaeon]
MEEVDKGKGKGEREDELTRIGVSLPANLLKKFDGIIRERGYSSRSEGIRDAIRSYIAEYEWLRGEAGSIIGTITFIYDHHQKGLSDAIIEIQHEFINVIKTAMHIHLDRENCLEVILVEGEAKDIKEVTEKIMKLKGVKHVKLTTTYGGL